MPLSPAPDFDWNGIAWGRPDSPPSALCSYCFAAIGEDDIPLQVWREDGACAQFCEACEDAVFGVFATRGHPR